MMEMIINTSETMKYILFCSKINQVSTNAIRCSMITKSKYLVLSFIVGYLVFIQSTVQRTAGKS